MRHTSDAMQVFITMYENLPDASVRGLTMLLDYGAHVAMVSWNPLSSNRVLRAKSHMGLDSKGGGGY